MSRALLARIAKLEASRPGENGGANSYRLLWVSPDMDAQQQKPAMITSGEAREDDKFIVISFVAPSENGPCRVYSPEPEGWSR
jgi:hypothetical protein